MFPGGVVDDVGMVGAVVREVIEVAGGLIVDGGTDFLKMHDEGEAAAPQEQNEEEQSGDEAGGPGRGRSFRRWIPERAETFANFRVGKHGDCPFDDSNGDDGFDAEYVAAAVTGRGEARGRRSSRVGSASYSRYGI